MKGHDLNLIKFNNYDYSIYTEETCKQSKSDRLLEQEAAAELRKHRDLLAKLVGERTRDLEIARENAARQQAENELAQGIIDRLTQRHGRNDAHIRYWLQPAENFSGDCIAATCADDGRLYAMLADATGHGLSAAITVVPVLTLFYRMVAEVRSLDSIVAAINREIKETLPPGRFVAAILLEYDPAAGMATIWHGAMPDILHIDASGEIKGTYRAAHIPLGIVDADAELMHTRRLAVVKGDRLLMFSDGLLEAENSAGQCYGMDGVLAALRHGRKGELIDKLKKSLQRHLEGRLPHDDISVLLIDCTADVCRERQSCPAT